MPNFSLILLLTVKWQLAPFIRVEHVGEYIWFDIQLQGAEFTINAFQLHHGNTFFASGQFYFLGGTIMINHIKANYIIT